MVCAAAACSKVKVPQEGDPASESSSRSKQQADAPQADAENPAAAAGAERATKPPVRTQPGSTPTTAEPAPATPATPVTEPATESSSDSDVEAEQDPPEPQLTAGSSSEEPAVPEDPDADAGALPPPDLSCAAFAGTTGGLAACGSLQPWVAPALGHEGFAVNQVHWLPVHASDGWVALVISKRDGALRTETYISAYLFDEQGACVQHIGTIENAVAFYPIQPEVAVVRGGTTAVLVGHYGRHGILGGFTLLANGKAMRNVSGDARMDVTPQGEIVLAQTPWQESVGYTLELKVLDSEGTLLREAAPPSPGLIADLDASEAGQLIVLYGAQRDDNGVSQPSRRVDRYDSAALALQSSWLAPENVNLTALDVQAGKVAVAGDLWDANTVWAQVLELPGWTAVWPAAAEAPDLWLVDDVDLTADGRVLMVGNVIDGDAYAWLMGYGASGTPLWSEPRKLAWGSLSRLSAQQNGHILFPGAYGYCD